jgi:hypothetical protein
MRIRFTLQAIPVSLTAMLMWAVIGGWYVPAVPDNLSGTDNIGIVLSIFGSCLFLADRLAFYWLKITRSSIIFPLWSWGLIFIAWGLLEWVKVFSRQYLVLFITHWLVIAAVIATGIFLVRSQRRAAGR